MITVGIINYNKEAFIEECIFTAMYQNFPPKEIIIVDDCSTDNSKQRIEHMIATNKTNVKIKAIYFEENSGDPAEPINTIIELTKTDYLFLTASDDFLYQDALKMLHTEIQKGGYDFVTSGLMLVNEEGSPQEAWIQENIPPHTMVAEIWKTGGSGKMTTAGLYRTSFLKDVGYIKYHDIESDVINTLNYIKNKCRYKIMQEPLIAYRQHAGNNSKDLKKRVNRVGAIMDFIVKNFPPRIFLAGIPIPNVGRDQFVNVIIAKFYLAVSKLYIENKLPAYLNVSATDEELKQLAQPLLLEARKYLSEAEKHGEYYWEEIIDTYEEIDSLLTPS